MLTSPHREPFLGGVAISPAAIVRPAAGGDGELVGGGGHGARPPKPGGLPPARLAPAGGATESPSVIALGPCLRSLLFRPSTLVWLMLRFYRDLRGFVRFYCAAQARSAGHLAGAHRGSGRHRRCECLLGSLMFRFFCVSG